MPWYEVNNNHSSRVMVKEISKELARRKAMAILKREATVNGLKNVYKHKSKFWTDLTIKEVK